MSLRWLPNAICIVRILLVVPIVALLLREQFLPALLLFIVAGVSDGVDGFLAKHFDWRTRLGGLLDPAADKILLVSVFLTLTWLGLVPWTLTMIVVSRDVVIVLGALTYQLLIAPVRGEPSLISKLNTACQLAFVLCMLAAAAFGWTGSAYLLPLGAAVVFTSIVSGLNYVLIWGRRAWQSVHTAREPAH